MPYCTTPSVIDKEFYNRLDCNLSNPKVVYACVLAAQEESEILDGQ